MSTNTATVNYQWTDYQAHVRDELETGDHDVVVLRVGYGGGKSRCGAQWIHRGGMADGGGVGESLVMAQDYEKGKSTTYSVFFKTLPGERTNPFKDGDPENSPIVSDYNQNDKRLVYITGHVVWLGGADKWSRFAGGEFARIWCDEVAHYPPQTDLYDLHRMLTTRQRTAVGPNTTLWTSTGNGFNAYYDITERQVQPDGDGGEEPLPWRDRLKVVVASTEHNTLLPPGGLEKIKRQFAGTAREEQGLHGGFAAAEGLVYDSFSRTTHVRPRETVEIRDDYRMYGYDYGWKDPRVLIEYGKTHADQYVAWDCYHVAGKPVEHAISWLRDNDKPAGPIYCDHDPEHIDKFRQAGYRAEAATKDLDEGIQEVQEVLDTDAEGRPGLVVIDDLVELIQEFQSYKEEDVGTSRAEDHCFIAGTPVLTESGERPIETIDPGDRVLTRDGFKPVLGAGKTAESQPVLTAYLSDGRALTGTPGHPIHTRSGGFVQLGSLRYENILTTVGRNGGVCQTSNLSSTRESHSGVTQTPRDAPTANTTGHRVTAFGTALKHSIGKCGRTLMALMKCLPNMLSTTPTGMRITTTPRTSNASLMSSICASTPTSASLRKRSGRESKRRKNGTNPRKAGSGIDSTGRKSPKRSKDAKRSVTNAESRLLTTASGGPGASARMPVNPNPDENRGLTTKSESAKPASSRSRPTNTAIEKPVRVVAVEHSSHGQNVYNLTVGGEPEYYANGILVHNCLDVTRYSVMGDRYVEDDDNSGTGTW